MMPRRPLPPAEYILAGLLHRTPLPHEEEAVYRIYIYIYINIHA